MKRAVRFVLLALCGAGLALALGAGGAAAQRRFLGLPQRKPPLVSFLPKDRLAEFIVAQFDIRTINSSMNRNRESYQARLEELGYRPQPRARAGDPLVLESNDGVITMSLFERGDHNLDGIEDVLVCFRDQTKDGRFSATQPLILQKYSDSTPLVALAVGIDDPRCPRSG